MIGGYADGQACHMYVQHPLFLSGARSWSLLFLQGSQYFALNRYPLSMHEAEFEEVFDKAVALFPTSS
jgi:hypothetical protein